MPIRRAKSMQTLYTAVADYDLVVCPDSPLADALDRRLAEPHFGTFATTPRRLAAGRRETAEDRTAFLELVDDLEDSWKAIAYAVGNVLQCWEYEGRHDAIFEYPAYVDDTTRAVVDAITDVDTTSGRLTDYEIDPERSVAVVGHDRLTPLERSILPDGVDRVDPFTDAAFDRPRFHLFDSAAAIVDAVLSTVTADDADRVAVVLDSGSRYSSLVESALAAHDVPYYGGPGFADDPDHRAFLGLLRAGFRGSDTTVADVRPLCDHLGIAVPVEHDAKRLESVDVPALEWVQSFLGGVDAMTFGDALACVEHRLRDGAERRAGGPLAGLRAELGALSVLDERVTRSRVEDLAYYLDRYEVPVDRDDGGVLLADATSAGFVDRPVVFHLGMDDGWTHAAPQRPWVDADVLFDRHLRAFQLLLQSGQNQYYLVQDSAGGQAVTPSLYLDELLDESFERFSDLASVTQPRVRRRRTAVGAGDGGAGEESGDVASTREDGVDDESTGEDTVAVDDSTDGDGYVATGFAREATDVDATGIQTISQSSLNTYVNCPRDYFFSRLVDEPDRDYFTEGTLFHDFAEFYVEHPDLVDHGAIADVVDRIHEESRSFFHADDAPLRRRKYRVGVEALMTYLDDNAPDVDGLDFLTPSSGWGTNPFAEQFGVSLDSPLAERWFENVPLGAKGKIDLVAARDHLLDYKSGSQSSATAVVRKAGIDPFDDTPNFQAALYLSHFRSKNPDERIDFSFFHFLEPLDVAVSDDGDFETALDEAITTVTYYPHDVDAFVASREAFDELRDHHADCAATFEALGFDRYREIVAGLSFPATTDREELRDSPFARDLTAAVDEATPEDVDAPKGCDQAIRKLNQLRKRAFFAPDLDAFESFLGESIDAINRCRAGDERFPIEGPGGEPNYRRVDHRDMLLEREP